MTATDNEKVYPGEAADVVSKFLENATVEELLTFHRMVRSVKRDKPDGRNLVRPTQFSREDNINDRYNEMFSLTFDVHTGRDY